MKKQGFWLIILLSALILCWTLTAEAEETNSQTKSNLTIKLMEGVEIKFPDVPKKIELGKQVVYLPKIADAPKIEIKGLPSQKTNTAPSADWTYLIQKYFPMTEWQNAEKIMMAESGGRYDAVSRTNDYGLFQINAVHKDRVGGEVYALLSPEINVRVAAELQAEQGWGIWTTAKKLGIH